MLATILFSVLITAFIIFELYKILEERKRNKRSKQDQCGTHNCKHCTENCGCYDQKKIKEW